MKRTMMILVIHGLDAAKRVVECDASLRAVREQWQKISDRFSGGKKPGKLAPVHGKGPAKGMYENKKKPTGR